MSDVDTLPPDPTVTGTYRISTDIEGWKVRARVQANSGNWMQVDFSADTALKFFLHGLAVTLRAFPELGTDLSDSVPG